MSLTHDLQKVEAFFNLQKDYLDLKERVEELEAKLAASLAREAEKVAADMTKVTSTFVTETHESN